MKTNCNQYDQKKEKAILALKNYKPTECNDVINIIETILKCYQEAEIKAGEKDCLIIREPKNQPKEVSFLLRELQSFIDGIKK